MNKLMISFLLLMMMVTLSLNTAYALGGENGGGGGRGGNSANSVMLNDNILLNSLTPLNDISLILTKKGNLILPNDVQETTLIDENDNALLNNLKSLKLVNGQDITLNDLNYVE